MSPAPDLDLDRAQPAPTTREAAMAALTAAGQPYELELVDVGGTPQRVFKNGPQTLGALFAETASDLPFLVYDDERLTFAQTYARAAQLAAILVGRYGVAKGDRVAIACRNYPEWVLAFTAVTSLGAIAVAINALWRPEEMAFGIADCSPKVLIADQERLDRFARQPPGAQVARIAVRPTRDNPGAPDLARLMAEAEAAGAVAAPAIEMLAAEVAPDDPATLFYTSGSTGNPKGVLCTHRNILSALMSWEVEGQIAALLAGAPPAAPAQQAATLLAIPLFHVTGSHAVYLASYRAQRKMVSMYKWDPEQAAALIEREAITSFVAPAAMTGDLVRVAQRTRHDLSTLLTVGGGGAPRAPEQVAQIDAAFANALPGTGWGMTETNAIGAAIGGLTYLERPASSGRCAAVLDLRIIDEAGHTLPAHGRGELLVRGTSVFRGYWNRPDVNAQAFVDGWFRTGDVAYLDDEGFLFIVDRIKDLIIRGGENIGCGHVEAALVKHPQVYEAAVYGVPDERLGEEVGATVYADPSLDIEALRAFLGEHLARFEVPRFLLTSPDPLPRTASGKILKKDLRAKALETLAP